MTYPGKTREAKQDLAAASLLTAAAALQGGLA